MRAAWLVLVAGAAGCLGDLDPEWQLDHGRIIAVRATPPHIVAGDKLVLDAFLAHKGAPTDVEAPTAAIVSPRAPASLMGVSVALEGSAWTVTAPDEAVLAAARTELMLDGSAPVPLEIGMTFGAAAAPLVATKFVFFGDAVDNPTITNPLVAGAPPAASLVIPTDTDVPLAVDADPTDKINWLTSCGTLHDDNEVKAFVHVLPADPMSGELAVVRRTAAGGVAFERWPIMTTTAGSGAGSGSN